MNKIEIINALNDTLKVVVKDKENILNTLNNTTNLKLHELMLQDEIEINDDDFNFFCNISYEQYEEFEKELGLVRHYIGRSSTFYLETEYFDMYNREYNGEVTIEGTVENIIENSGLDSDFIKIDKEGTIIDICSYDKEYPWTEYFEQYDLDLTIYDLKESVDRFIEEITSIVKGYNYIEEFKKNVVQIYKEYGFEA